MVVTAQRQRLRPGKCWGRKPGQPQSGTVSGSEPGGERQTSDLTGRTDGSVSVVKRPLQRGTEVHSVCQEDRTEGEKPGPQAASGALRFGLGAGRASPPGLTRPGVGSRVEALQDRCGKRRSGFVRSERQQE